MKKEKYMINMEKKGSKQMNKEEVKEPTLILKTWDLKIYLINSLAEEVEKEQDLHLIWVVVEEKEANHQDLEDLKIYSVVLGLEVAKTFKEDNNKDVVEVVE